jgi:hypothetical protein
MVMALLDLPAERRGRDLKTTSSTAHQIGVESSPISGPITSNSDHKEPVMHSPGD